LSQAQATDQSDQNAFREAFHKNPFVALKLLGDLLRQAEQPLDFAFAESNVVCLATWNERDNPPSSAKAN
jgi:hypothetical protein